MNIKLLIFNLLFGSIVLITYIYFLPKIHNLNVSFDEIWGNIKGVERNFTYFSMIISALSFIYVIYYFAINKFKNKKMITLGFIIFYIGAILWCPSLYNYFLNKNELNLLLMILTLCLTSLGILILLIYIYSLRQKYLLKIAISLFFFHVLFLDNINYSIRFLS